MKTFKNIFRYAVNGFYIVLLFTSLINKIFALTEQCPITISCNSPGVCQLPAGFMVYEVIDWKLKATKFYYNEVYAEIGDPIHPMIYCEYWDSNGNHAYRVSNKIPFYYASIINHGAGPWHVYQGSAYCVTPKDPSICTFNLYRANRLAV